MNILLTLTSSLFLLVCSAVSSAIIIGLLSKSSYEIKRKAQLGDLHAKKAYPFLAIQNQFLATLLIINSLLVVIVVLIFANSLNDVLVAIISALLIVFFVVLLPIVYLNQYALVLTSKLAVVFRYLIVLFSPLAKPLSRLLDKKLTYDNLNIYSKKELYKIIENHKASPYSDIEHDEAEIVRHALSFGDKKVRDVMTPRRVVVSVDSEEQIGPIIIDELHKSGHSRFPVYNDKKTQNFVGVLYLRDLVGLKALGKAKDNMRKEVLYIHEESPLAHALRIFLKTNSHLMVVVNTFEEFVGVLSIEDVLEQIIGKQIVDEFDQHADLRAVAKSLAAREAKQRQVKK
jgi:metal transporter CNNM